MPSRSIDDLDDPVLADAVAALEDGQALVFRHTGFVPHEDGLELRADVRMRFKDVTKADATAAKERAERDRLKLQASFPTSRLLQEDPVRLVVLDHYGTGGIEICRFDAKGMHWLLSLGTPE